MTWLESSEILKDTDATNSNNESRVKCSNHSFCYWIYWFDLCVGSTTLKPFLRSILNWNWFVLICIVFFQTHWMRTFKQNTTNMNMGKKEVSRAPNLNQLRFVRLNLDYMIQSPLPAKLWRQVKLRREQFD